jgi:hypothetical protein
MHQSFQSLRGVVAGAVACAGAGSKSMLQTANTCNGVISVYRCLAFFLTQECIINCYLLEKLNKVFISFFSFFTQLTIRFSFSLIISRLPFDTASFLWGNRFGLREFGLCDCFQGGTCHENRENMYELVHKRRHASRGGGE